jgi:peptidyl-prolyl cis-trans isomerase D
MISWIQQSFQKHFKLVFLLILVAMGVPLIVIFTPSSGIGNGREHVLSRDFFGYNLGSPDDVNRLRSEAGLSAQLVAGYVPDGDQLQNYAYQRAASVALADQLKVPAPSKQEIADYIKNLRMFAGQDGQFDAQRYASFRDSLKSNPAASEAAVSRVISDDIRAQKVQALIAGPGYVQPDEVKRQLERADSSWTLGVATVDYTSFHPTIDPTDAELQKFYTDNAFRYEIAPRVVVRAAEFPSVNYLKAVHVTDAEVRAYYDANPSRFPAPTASTKPAPVIKPDASANFAAVRPQVESALKLEQAQHLAAKAASDFSYAIYQNKLNPGTPEFDAFLAKQKVTLHPVAPFTQEAGPVEFGGSPEIATEAFKLGPDRTYSDALKTPAGAAVLFWQKVLPAHTPDFADVRAKVAADYTEGEKRKRFVDLGRTIRSRIETSLKSGAKFEAAVASAATTSSVKIAGKLVPPFTLRQPPHDLDYAVFGTLDRLDRGEISDMVLSKDHGVLVYVADKKIPDLSTSNPQYAAVRTQIASVNARIDSSAFINEFIQRELKKSGATEEN